MSDIMPPIPDIQRLAVRRDRRPLREVVREELRGLIRDGRLPAGQKLPPEPQLAEHLGISRATLREAIHALAQEGLLVHRRGVGTFVVGSPVLRNNLDGNFGVTQLIQSMGLRPGIRWKDVREEPAGQLAASRLDINVADPILMIERVRTADGKPVVYSVDVIPRSIAQHRPLFTNQQSVYEYLEEQCGQIVQYGVARLLPAVADSRVARLLGVKLGTLLMVIDQVDYSVEGKAVLFSLEHHLVDAFEMTVFRKGPGSTTGMPRRIGA